MKQLNYKHQQGLTTLGLLFVIASFSFFILTAFKVGPMYMDFYQAQTIVKTVADDESININSRREIWAAISKRLKINNIRSLGKEDFIISRDREKAVTVVNIKYEVRETFVADTFIGASFDKTIEISR